MNNKKSLEILQSKIGKEINGILIIKQIEHENPKYKGYRWIECLCKCGNSFKAKFAEVNRGAITSCGCGYSEHNKRYKGIENLSGSYLCRIKHNAKNRKIDFSVTIEEMHQIYKIQNGKCKISGENISLKRNNNLGEKQTASLDRINSSKGYTKDNIQWVHKTINMMKQDFSEERFIELCKAVAAHNQESTCQTNFQEA